MAIKDALMKIKHIIIIIIASLYIMLAPGRGFPEAAPESPILKLDTGGHMGLIGKVIPMKDGKRFITASDDKTVRIWDTETGEEQASVLGQIGCGVEGQIFAIALTPDERYLAVGGFLDKEFVYRHAIRIYDLLTGSLVQILKSHENVVLDLSVSPDGRYLVSGSADTTVKIWEIGKGFSLVHTFSGHTNHVYAVGAFRQGDDYHIVSVGYDNKAILWSLEKKKMINSYTHENKLKYLALNDTFIATSGSKDKKILIFDRALNKVRDVESETVPEGLAFCPNGRLLLSGTGSKPFSCAVYDSRDGFKKLISFAKHDNTTMAVAFTGDRAALTCGGNGNDIYLWDAYTGEVRRRVSGNGNVVWSVGIKGREIAFGIIGLSEESIHNHSGQLQKSINLDTFVLHGLNKDEAFTRIVTFQNGLSLSHEKGGDYGKEDAVLIISKDGKEQSRITRDSRDGYLHRTYGFTENGAILSGGAGGFLAAYTPEGEKKASFIGHTGEVWGIATWGTLLVSGSSDQTIRVWNLEELKAGKKEIFPIVSIFVSTDNDWVIWNEQGFYDASPNGDRFVGWHMNHGPDKAAEYYRARQFRRYLYRPDIIKKTIALGSGEKAIAEMSKKEPSLAKITVSELIKRAPVDVRVDSVVASKDGTAVVKVRLGQNNTTAPERITIYVNGAQVLPEDKRSLKGVKPGDVLTYSVRLTGADNHIKVTVENQWAENSAHTRVKVPEGAKIVTSKETNLYVAAIGISRYPLLNARQQLSSPPLDARTIAEKFKKLEGRLYKNVDVKVLADSDTADVTAAMAEKAIAEQARKAGPQDTLVVFLSGHGVTDTGGSYHFVTADTKIKNAWGEQDTIGAGTSLDWTRLHRILDRTMGRRLVIVDTCQAGEVFSENSTDISRLVKDIHDVNAVVYSGTSRQDTGIETPEGGVFTLSIVSGFDGKAAYREGVLPFESLKEYVDREVPRRNGEIMRRIYQRGVKVDDEAVRKKVNFDSVQKPRAVVPEGMDGFVIYAR